MKMDSPYKKTFKDDAEKLEYKFKLQQMIDEKAQEIKKADNSFTQESLIREVLILYKVKEANYGLGLTNRLGLNIIKNQLKAITNANNLMKKGIKV